MPIYDYRCTACDHLSEVIHGINDPGPRFCESCGAEGTMRKGVTTPAVLYKGSGWARKDRGPGASGASSGSAGGSEASGDGAASGAKAGSGGPKAGGSSDAAASSDTAASSSSADD